MKTREQYKTTLRTMLEFRDPPHSFLNPRARGGPDTRSLVAQAKALPAMVKAAFKDLPLKVKVGGPIMTALMAANEIPNVKKAYAQDGIGGAISVGSAELLRLGAGGIGARFGGSWGSLAAYTAVDQALAASGLAWKESPDGMLAKASRGLTRRINADNDKEASRIAFLAQDAAISAGKDVNATNDAYWDSHDAEVKRQMELDGPVQAESPISTMPPTPGLIDKVQSSKRLRSQVAEIEAQSARSNERRDQKVAQADAERATARAKHAEWMARHEADEPRRAAGLARSDDVIAQAFIHRQADSEAQRQIRQDSDDRNKATMDRFHAGVAADKALRDKSISTQPK